MFKPDNSNLPWTEIIKALVPKLRFAIETRPSHVPCPVHGGKDGLRCFNDFDNSGGMVCNTCGFFPNGYLVLSWVLGISTRKAAELVCQYMANEKQGNVIHLPSSEMKPSIDENASREMREILAGCVPLTAPEAEPARRYFWNRGIISEGSTQRALHVDNLRFYRYLDYPSRPRAAYPALVASIVRDGQLVGLHRTYLTDGGEKARGGDSKRIGPIICKGATSGGAIPLLSAAEEMAVAEGLESALAVYEESGMPIWAAVSAGSLATMDIPDLVQKLVIFADNDANNVGQEAAERLARRMRSLGKKVRVYVPDRPKGLGLKSFDILDHLLEGRRDGFH